MQPNLTPRARLAVELAQQYAGPLGCEYVGTEHLLLGLLNVSGSEAHRILTQLGIDEEKVRALLKNC